MREKTSRLEKDIEQLREQHETDVKADREERRNFVTHKHLDAVIEPMRRVLETLTRDVKEILRVVSASHRSED